MAHSNAFRGKVMKKLSASTEVNPTFSLSKAPKAVPTNGGKQVNPTPGAAKSEAAVKAPKGMRLNPTYAVSHKSAENSKGKSGKQLAAAKRGMGNPVAGPNHPKPLQEDTMKGRASKVTATPTRNESAPYGENKRKAAPMTVARLKKLGY